MIRKTATSCITIISFLCLPYSASASEPCCDVGYAGQAYEQSSRCWALNPCLVLGAVALATAAVIIANNSGDSSHSHN